MALAVSRIVNGARFRAGDLVGFPSDEDISQAESLEKQIQIYDQRIAWLADQQETLFDEIEQVERDFADVSMRAENLSYEVNQLDRQDDLDEFTERRLEKLRGDHEALVDQAEDLKSHAEDLRASVRPLHDEYRRILDTRRDAADQMEALDVIEPPSEPAAASSESGWSRLLDGIDALTRDIAAFAMKIARAIDLI